MVWGLFPVDPLPGEDNYYFFDKGTYKVGRKGCDVIVKKDKGVSRIHAEISIDEMSSLDHSLSNILSKVRIKDCSKNGTYLNKNVGSTEKVHEFPNKETMLKDGDLVSFGTGDATYRFSYVSFIFFICCPKNSNTNQLITMKVSSIGANITKKWSLDCSHVLVDDSFPVSEDLINAIVARKPLVQYSWLELIAGKNICTAIPSYSSHAPTLMLEGVSVKTVDPPSRKYCLKGYTFLLEPENEYKFQGRLQSLLEAGGANVSLAEVALEKSDHVICVVPAGSHIVECFPNLRSLPWVTEIDLVSAILSGYLDPSLVASPPDHFKKMIRVGPNTFGSGFRTGLKDRLHLKDFPAVDPDDYEAMPVEMFGMAYLRAFGHEVKLDKNTVVQSACRPARMGLGYIPPCLTVPRQVSEYGDELPSPSHDEE
ncbi:nibrin homolog [Lycium ferocissimum]|uniref:nibrin homolog n=1 Tax=Lycium ferocissimum TaxID=112874 RepID=UPI0028155FAF|nr:nibrin homolog [Lycium ferocissimum]